MLRQIFPKAVHQGRAMVRRCAETGRPGGPMKGARNFFYRAGRCHRDRDLPVWRHRHPIQDVMEDFMHRGSMFGGHPLWARRVEEHFRDMERHLDKTFFGGRWRPYEYYKPAGKTDMQVKYDSKEFEVKMNVSEFAVEEVHVKQAGNQLVVTAEHQQRPDEHGHVARSIHRRIEIPEDVEVETLESHLTADGELIVRANVKTSENVKERTIEIKNEASPSDKKEKE